MYENCNAKISAPEESIRITNISPPRISCNILQEMSGKINNSQK
jgi:hypothetical protein